MDDHFSWWEIVKGVFLLLIAVINGWLIPKLNQLSKRVETVAKESNGMKGELVEAAKVLGEAVGHAKGVKEEKQRSKVQP